MEPTVVQVRQLVEELTGQRTVGVIVRRVFDGSPLYQLRSPSGMMLCKREEDGSWAVTILDAEGKPGGTWRGDSAGATASAEVLNQIFAQIFPSEEPFNAVYRKSFTDPDDIQRKLYDSTAGEVWLHTRRRPGGTEGVIEIPRRQLMLHYFWESETGTAEFSDQPLTELPF